MALLIISKNLLTFATVSIITEVRLRYFMFLFLEMLWVKKGRNLSGGRRLYSSAFVDKIIIGNIIYYLSACGYCGEICASRGKGPRK